MSNERHNPFHILGLPIDASDEAIVRRGQSLINTAQSDEQRQLYRWAIDELTLHPLTRLEHALYEFPETAYRDTQWEAFIKKHKRQPAKPDTSVPSAAPLTLADVDMAALLDEVLAALLDVPLVDLEQARKHAPFSMQSLPLPLEVRDVIFG